MNKERFSCLSAGARLLQPSTEHEKMVLGWGGRATVLVLPVINVHPAKNETRFI